MKRLIGLVLVIFIFLACAGTAVLLAIGLLAFSATPGSSESTLVLPAPPASDLSVPADPSAPALGSPGEGVGQGSDPATDGNAAASGFNGTFNGTLTADNGSTAPATLTLTESGGAVSGRLAIGDGLSIDAGTCGVVAVPAGEQDADGAVDPANPNRLATTVRMPAQGLTVVATMEAELLPGGRDIAARVAIDLPFFCGRDPGISGAFSK